MTLSQLVLHELWENQRDGYLTHASYEAHGALRALIDRADATMESLPAAERPLALQTLLKLVVIDEQGQLIRKQVRRNTLSAEEEVAISAFVDASLLVGDQSPAAAAEDATIRVAHEALLHQWPPLCDAIEDSWLKLQLRSDLERLAADWQQSRRNESYLLRGRRLDQMNQWATQHPGELGPLEQEFLEASGGLATRELEATRRRNRRLRTLAGGLALLLVVALLVSVLAVNARREAQAQSRLALSRQVAGEAEQLVNTRPDTAILAGLQSLSLARDHEAAPSSGLITALARVTHASQQLAGHAGAVYGVAFSRDGRLLATASQDGTLRLW
ncbi:WD domain-containing protein, G-beta repeat-containing protein, partial [Geodermatophilus africanus]